MVSLTLFAPVKSATARASLVVLKLMSELACRSCEGKATNRPMAFYAAIVSEGMQWCWFGLTYKVPVLASCVLVDENHPLVASDLSGHGVSRSALSCE
jgi:hypothetical protein